MVEGIERWFKAIAVINRTEKRKKITLSWNTL